ncbi:MAG: DUF3798 domain-containing protein [Defluviitaleaceae bacterium]|nr:DUF3798 domain-containing protein [Defluviitaleaceae bacterium]
MRRFLIAIIGLLTLSIFVACHDDATVNQVIETERSGALAYWQGLHMDVDMRSVTSTGLRLSMINNSESETFGYSSPFSIEQYLNGTWVQVPFIDDIFWTEPLFMIDPESSVDENVSWVHMHGQLASGQYRIIRHFIVYDWLDPTPMWERDIPEAYLYALFTVDAVQIAVITDERLTIPSHHQGNNWVVELIARHGRDNVIIYTWEDNEAAAMIGDIAENPQIQVVIISPAWRGEPHNISAILRGLRDDIFIFYPEHLDISQNANLALEINTYEMDRNFPAKARTLGARTLVYFYDSFMWDEDEVFEETPRHNMMRELSGETGLHFVAVDIDGAIQCGSSYQAFLIDTIPPLIERYGPDVVFFGLDNERMFWMRNGDMIYLPMPSMWFEPHILDIAHEFGILNIYPEMYDIPLLIEGIRAVLEIEGSLGRVAAFPISMQFLFPIAAAEYGIMRANGKVPQAVIDIQVLQQIMVDLIAEYTGLNHGISLTAVSGNHILVTPDYFVF